MGPAGRGGSRGASDTDALGSAHPKPVPLADADADDRVRRTANDSARGERSPHHRAAPDDGARPSRPDDPSAGPATDHRSAGPDAATRTHQRTNGPDAAPGTLGASGPGADRTAGTRTHFRADPAARASRAHEFPGTGAVRMMD